MSDNRKPGGRPLVYETPLAIRAWSRDLRCGQKTLALVPTMGALHRGHRELLKAARQAADAVVASIFVNPAQFGPGEDLASYPRTLEADLAACADEGVDAVYAPTGPAVYAADHSTWVREDVLAAGLEGAIRPGHFQGVLTVVLKLFNTVEPDLAIFGQKDIQQALLIRRMARDLLLPVEIQVAPTVRDADGLALSSRNRYLSPEDRGRAPALWQALSACGDLLESGESRMEVVLAAGMEILDAVPGLTVDYLQVVDMETLAEPPQVGRPLVVAGAVRLGKTRLIDNILSPPGALAGSSSGVNAS
jgi:pantoate--beta-alanine ligase